MNILHVITRLILGGAQQNTVLSCRAQIEAGHDVTLAFGPIFGPEGSLRDEAAATGAKLVELPHMCRAVRPWSDLLAYRQLRQLIHTLRPNVVHTHSSKAGIVARAAAWHENVPAVVHTVHGLAFHDRQPGWVSAAYVRAERWAAKRCHHMVAITPAMVEAFVKHRIATADRMTVIPSGIEIDRFVSHPNLATHARRDMGVPADAKVIATVARLDPLKGHDDLLDVLPAILKRVPDAYLVCIGDGWHRKAIEQHIARERLADRVRLLGLVSMDEVARLLCGVDVKVLASYQEGQSRTLAEGLLCGCGIVGYDVGGIPSLCIDGKTGRLVPVGDKSVLTDAIVWMLEHPQQRAAMSQAGRALVEREFSAAAMNTKLLALYDELLAQHKEPSP